MAKNTPTLSGTYTLMIDALRQNAERDADLAADFLDRVCFPDRVRPTDLMLKFPRTLLLGIGVAMRLGTWEAGGIDIHIRAGIPRAEKIWELLFGDRGVVRGYENDQQIAEINSLFLKISIERLAWSGYKFMGADVVLNEVEEDVFVNVLAEFLWRHRDSGRAS